MSKKSLRNLRVSDNLDRVDMARLKSNRYSELSDGWNKVFVIRHKKYSHKVAELRALSFVHACNLIGWRPRQVELIRSEDIEDKTEN